MAKAMSSRDLWQRTLERADISTAEIQLMLDQQVREDHWLDWKGGKLFDNSRHAGQKLRRACAGFMNADGGVLAVGVNGGDPGTGEQPWTLSPWDAKAEKGRQSLEERVMNMLQPIDPPPRVPPIVHRTVEGDVMLLGVQRSTGLVRVFDGDRPQYFMRWHDSSRPARSAVESLAMPDSLVADVMLGRRARPALEVVSEYINLLPETAGEPFPLHRHTAHEVWEFSVRLTIVNSNPMPATNATAILVHPLYRGEVPAHLARHCSLNGGCYISQRELGTVPGLGTTSVEFQQLQGLRHRDGGRDIHWSGAVFLTSGEAMPRLYQVHWDAYEWEPRCVRSDVTESARPSVGCNLTSIAGHLDWLP